MDHSEKAAGTHACITDPNSERQWTVTIALIEEDLHWATFAVRASDALDEAVEVVGSHRVEELAREAARSAVQRLGPSQVKEFREGRVTAFEFHPDGSPVAHWAYRGDW